MVSEILTPEGDIRSSDIDRLLSLDEVAQWLGVTRSTLYGWRHTRRGPRSLKVGGSVRYRRADVLAWLDQCSRPGRP